MAIDSPQFTIADLTTASQQVILPDDVVNLTRVIIDNTEGSTAAYVTTGATSQTAVFPTSLTVPSYGTVVGAGTVQTYTCHTTDKYFAAIRQSGTANLYVKLGSGE